MVSYFDIPEQPSGWPIIGHARAVELLRLSLRSDRLAHAYLFTGPDGIGKHALAVLLAMSLNCTGEKPEGQPWPDVPCLLCPSCSRISRGEFPDVAEISLETQALADPKRGQAARELKIDAIREMQATVGLNPYAGRRKVYIISDADKLNEEAANCLLKTLEEPPSHTVLVLLAPSAESLLPTISSRCIHIQLRTLSRANVDRSLVQVWGADPDLAGTLAALSGGRLGYAARLLQDREALSRRRDALEEVTLLTGATITTRMDAAARLAKRYTDARAEVFATLDEWETWWRDVLVVKAGAAELATGLDQMTSLQSVARRISVEGASDAVRLVQRTRQQLLENVNPRLALEALTLGLP